MESNSTQCLTYPACQPTEEESGRPLIQEVLDTTRERGEDLPTSPLTTQIQAALKLAPDDSPAAKLTETLAEQMTVSSLVNKLWWVSTLLGRQQHKTSFEISGDRGTYITVQFTEELTPQSTQVPRSMSIPAWEFTVISNSNMGFLCPFLIKWALRRSWSLIQPSGKKGRPLLLEIWVSVFFSFLFILRTVAFSENRFLLLEFLAATILTKYAGPDMISSPEKRTGFDTELSHGEEAQMR